MALREFTPLRQLPGERPRRWFVSDELDLILWMDSDGEVAAFQLFQKSDSDEWGVGWDRERRGLRHFRVDSGEGRPLSHKATPVLISAPARPVDELVDRFRRECDGLDAGVAALVLGALTGGSSAG